MENNKNNYKSKIANTLSDSASGLTITDLSKTTKIHRNTVSKYVNILEAEGLITKKDIGKAKLYFSKERKYLRRDLVNKFMQALLYAVKSKIPFEEQLIRDIGWKILDRFQFPIGDAYLKEFKKYRGISDPQKHLKLFREFYNSFDFFQEDIDIFIVELLEKKVIYRFSNSEYLSEDYYYFFYLMCGLTEGIYKQNLDLKVKCNVENINISKNGEESYIDISLEIQSNH